MEKFLDRDLFKQRLSELMSDNNDTTYSLAEYLGLSAATISRYTTGNMLPKIPTIQAIAEKYHINPKWLMGQPGEDKYIDRTGGPKRIPIISKITHEKPIVSQELIEGFEYVSEDSNANFCIKMRGDSMIGARILDGDIVYISQQLEVENGDIALVYVKDEATLMRVYRLDKSLILRAENPSCQDMIFTKDEAKNVKIIGKAVMFKSEVR